MHEDNECQLDSVAAEIADEFRAGRTPSVAIFCDRYPDLAQDIRELFPALVRLELARPAEHEQTIVAQLDAAARLGRPDEPPLGDYRIVREIGRGGMGIVYEALQESLNRRVALKVLSPWISRNPRQVQRFEREAQAAATLHHTNIVPVFGVGQDRGMHYLVMQLIPGFALDEVLAALRSASIVAPTSGDEGVAVRTMASRLIGNDFPHPSTVNPVELHGKLADRGLGYWRSVARIGLQAAEALAYAHHQEVIHRDIKPSNLLIDDDGTVWIADFGLAKTRHSVELTMTGEMVGTVRYMPPERLTGQSGPAGDLYGLGATLYELVTLQPPFGETDNAELLKQVTDFDPQPPRAIDGTIPRDLETIIVKAMAKRPSDRYPNAAALAVDLQLFLQDRPIRARRTWAIERFSRWCRRNPTVAIPSAAAILLAIAIVAGAIIATALLSHENQLARAAEHRALGAEDAQREELFRAHLSSVRRSPATGRPGQRLDGLKAVQAANSILHQGELTDLRRSELIDAAIPCLTRVDSREVFRVPAKERELRVVAVDSAFERFAYSMSDDQGTVVEHLFGPPSRQEFPGVPEERSSLSNWRGFSRAGKWLCEVIHRSPHNDSQRIRVWNCASRDLALELLPEPSGCVSEFHPDERHILIAGGDGVLRLFDLESGKLIRESPARFPAPVPRFSNDGQLLAMGSLTSDPMIINPDTWETIAHLPEVGPARSFVWTPQDTNLIVGNLAGRLYQWDHSLAQGRFLNSDNDLTVQELRISKDAQWLAVSTGASVQVRHLTGDQVHLEIAGSAPAFSPDGNRLAVVSQNQVRIHELIPAPSFTNIGTTADAAEFSSDGTWLVASGPAGAQVFATDGLRWIGDLGLDHSGPAAFRRNGNELLTFGLFSHAWHWPFKAASSLQIGPPRAVVPQEFLMPIIGGLKPQHQGRHAAFTDDGQSVVFADYRNDRVVVAELASGKTRTLAVMPNITRVAVSPDEKWIAGAAPITTTVRVWDAVDGRLVLDLREHYSVAFRSDGRRLAARSRSAVDLYDTDTWTRVLRIEPMEAPTDHDAPVTFQPVGNVLAVATSSRRVQFFDSETGVHILNLPHHGSRFASWLSFTPDGARLAVTRRGHEIVVWDLCSLQKELLGLGLAPRRFAPEQPARTAHSLEKVHIERGDLPSTREWHLYWKSLALSEASKKRWPDAIHAATKSLEQVPTDDALARVELLTIRGDYRYRNHNWLGAREDWELAIALTPTATSAARSLTRLHLVGPANVRDPRRAPPLIALMEQNDARPTECELLRALAGTRLGRFTREDQVRLERLIKESDWSHIGVYFLALSQHGLGNHNQAAETLTLAEQWLPAQITSLDECEREELERIHIEVLHALRKP